jgi:ABC-type multidrug transport system fused ATPase/permease subunit
MDKGTVAEYDTPANLLRDKSSMFAALVADWENAHE